MTEGPESSGSVRVVGTAHVSADSVEEVEQVIETDRPDVVAVELDEDRYRQMKGETPDDLDATDLLQGNTVFQFLAYWMLSYVQAQLGDEFDITPGADMLAGVETAERLGIDVALVDRDIQMTIQRFWARLSFIEKIKIIGSLALGAGDPIAVALGLGAFIGAVIGLPATMFFGPLVVPAGVLPAVLVTILDFLLVATVIGGAVGLVLTAAFLLTAPDDDVEDLDMSELTDADVVTAMMEEFRQFSPGGAEALIDERDAYIAHKLVALRDSGQNVVAIVGAGHRAGIQSYLDAPETLPDYDSLVGTQSSRFSVYKLFGYLFTLGFLLFFALLAIATLTGVEGASGSFLLRLFGAWFLINGVFSAALAKAAGAHWPSALAGGAVAWLTSVNPLLAPGWFAGYVELRYIDVNVSNIATLNEIVSDEERPIMDILADLRAVPLFRLILIVALTNIGSFIASIVFASVVIPALFADLGGSEEILRLMLEAVRNSVELLRGLV